MDSFNIECDLALAFLKRWRDSYVELISDNDEGQSGNNGRNRFMRDNYARCIRLIEQSKSMLKSTAGDGHDPANDAPPVKAERRDNECRHGE